MNLRKLSIRRLGLTVSVMTAVCFLQSGSGHRALMAQQIIVNIDGRNKTQVETHRQLKEIYEGKRAAAKNRINSLLHDIDRACDLSAAQRERLEIAGKGAVDSHAGKTLKKIETAAKSVGLDFKLRAPPEKEDDEEGNDVRGGRMTVLDLGNGRNGENKVQVESEKIWTKSIKNSLNEEQQAKLKSWQADRKKLIQKAAVDHFIAKADLKMFLSLQQREELRTFVDNEYGEELARQVAATPAQNRRFFVGRVPQQVASDIEVDEALTEILSKSQLDIWRTELQSNLDSLD